MRKIAIGLAFTALLTPPLRGDERSEQDALVGRLRDLDTAVITAGSPTANRLPQMLSLDVRARRDAANRRETEAWQEIKTRADWERYRNARIQALRASLGPFPPAPRDLNVRVTRTLQGDGYRIE